MEFTHTLAMHPVERRWLRARRYAFHPDEVAEAEAQGLPYALVPRVCSSSREWMERYAEQLPSRTVCWMFLWPCQASRARVS